ncbi:MAG: SDR family NAD(P)-dependent oxidoreductase, partial [Steroidobacteraceae bacterium]
MDAFAAGEYADEDLPDVAYTLQIGREPMAHRLGSIASSVEELRAGIEAFLDGRAVGAARSTGAPFVATGEASTDGTPEARVEASCEHPDCERLVESWVRGARVDWSPLHVGRSARRLSLPSYPFERRRFWAEDARPTVEATAIAHPLLHTKRSSAGDLAFDASFTGSEFFLADHVVNGRKVLPGVAHLEMACASIQAAAGVEGARIRLTDVTWIRQLAVGEEGASVRIRHFPQPDGTIRFEIRGSEVAGASHLFSQGRARVIDAPTRLELDLAGLQVRCSADFAPVEECYGLFAAMGIQYGPGHRALRSVKWGRDRRELPQILARIELPASIEDTHAAFHLHPSVLDAALQTTMLFPLLGSRATSTLPALAIPFALTSVQGFRPCPKYLWAWVRFSADHRPGDARQELDITLCDQDGATCVEMKGLLYRAVADAGHNEDFRVSLLRHEWQAVALDGNAAPIGGEPMARHVLLIGSFDEAAGAALGNALPRRIAFDRCSSTDGAGLEDEFQTHAMDVLAVVQQIAKSDPARTALLQLVVATEGEEDARRCLAALAAMLKTAELEHPKLIAQCIQIPRSMSFQAAAAVIEAESRQRTAKDVRYRGLTREVRRFVEVHAGQREVGAPWRHGGVYLITGGAGGLGLSVAEAIAGRAERATLVIAGRSVLAPERRARLAKLEAQGARVDYQIADVTQRSAVQSLIDHCVDRYGTVHGVIHCAGVIHDGLIVRKTDEELCRVLAAKVHGLINID